MDCNANCIFCSKFYVFSTLFHIDKPNSRTIIPCFSFSFQKTFEFFFKNVVLYLKNAVLICHLLYRRTALYSIFNYNKKKNAKKYDLESTIVFIQLERHNMQSCQKAIFVQMILQIEEPDRCPILSSTSLQFMLLASLNGITIVLLYYNCFFVLLITNCSLQRRIQGKAMFHGTNYCYNHIHNPVLAAEKLLLLFLFNFSSRQVANK